MKVEIGEYLRLDNGCIYKWESNDYEWIYEEDEQLVYGNGANEYEWECDIKEHSFNIIDLIEVGDYVNGQLVKHIAYFEGVEEPIKKLIFADEYHLIPTEVCEQNEIKSIVTHEQFSQMEYKVGE